MSFWTERWGNSTFDIGPSLEDELKKQASDQKETTLFQHIQGRVFACALSPSTEVIVIVLLVLDVLLLLWGVHMVGFAPDRRHWTAVCHAALLVVFSLEMVARTLTDLFSPKARYLGVLRQTAGAVGAKDNSCSSVLAEVGYARRFPLSVFVLLDSSLVVFGIVGAFLWGLQSCATILPSMLRISRLADLRPHSRAMFLRPLELLVSTMCCSTPAILSAFGLLLLNLLFFAVLAMGVLQPQIEEHMRQDAIVRFGAQTVENCRYAFSSLFVSMSTLFALSIGDQWYDIAFPIIYFMPWAFVIFMLHAAMASGLIIGLVYGVLHQTLQRFHARQAQLNEVSQASARSAVLYELTSVFQDIDADGSGYITWQEFHHNRKNNMDFARILDKLNLKDPEILIIWDIMDTSRDGRVSKEEFVDFMWKILFDEGKWSHLKTMHCAANSSYQSEQVRKHVLDIQEELLTHRRLLEQILDRGTGMGHGLSMGTSNDSQTAALRSDNEMGLEPSLGGVVGEKDAELTTDSAIELMRGVGSDLVSRYGNDDVVTFWSGGSFIDKLSDREFNMSLPCKQCDYFVSHCWAEPQDWHTYFERNNRLQSYAYMKAVELHSILFDQRSLKLRRDSRWKSGSEATLWVDKCCIPQNDKKTKAICVALIEEFMNLSNGFIVILSWQYFTRLWCVYEWACFLRTKSPFSVELGFDAFLKSDAGETLPLYLGSIEQLSVEGSQCFIKDDHAILEAKVFQYYNGSTPEESFAAFERFAKCTAISLMAKQIMLWRARDSASDEKTWLDPFRSLADKLGYHQLVNVLSRAQPAKWFSECKRNQEAFDNVLLYWFEHECVHYLIQERLLAIRKFPKGLRASFAEINRNSVLVDVHAEAAARPRSMRSATDEAEWDVFVESFEEFRVDSHLGGVETVRTNPIGSGATTRLKVID